MIDIQEQIASLVERAARDAYQAGYAAGERDALARIIHAAPPHFVAAADMEQERALPDNPVAIKLLTGPAPAAEPDGAAAPRPRVRRGVIKDLVRDFVNAKPGSKESHFAALHPTLKRSSCYMAYQALANEGVIRRDGKYWFPASMQWFCVREGALPGRGIADHVEPPRSRARHGNPAAPNGEARAID